MNTRNFLIGAALAGVLGCTGVNAQVLGGGLGGDLIGNANGGLSGGLRDLSMTGGGAAAGSLGADLETQTLRRATRDTTQHAVGRVRGTTQQTRDRMESTVGEARNASQHAAMDVASSATATAAHTADPQQLSGAAQLAGSAASNVSASSAALASATPNEIAEQAPVAPADPVVTAPRLDSATSSATTPAPLLKAAGEGGVESEGSFPREPASASSSFAADAHGAASVSAER